LIDPSGSSFYATSMNINFRRLGACFATEASSIDWRHVTQLEIDDA